MKLIDYQPLNFETDDGIEFKVSNGLKFINYKSINGLDHSVEIHTDNDITLTTCTVTETSFNLISLITGSGLLALPFAAATMGYSAIFLFVLVASAHMYTLLLIGICINITEKRRIERNIISNEIIDYLTLGTEAFGNFGGLLVAITLSLELLLAIVSFFINIGFNFKALNSSFYPIYGIIFATIVSLLLCSLHLKYAAYSSAFGVMMNSLIIGSLIITSYISNNENSNNQLHYSLWNSSGVPLSLGLISFCFGGHGASPGIYSSMQDKSKYSLVLIYSSIVVIAIYLSVMIIGYFSFGEYTAIPVTLNIGRLLNGSNIHTEWINGRFLRSVAAIGIIFNLQVTSPLVTYPLREVLFKTILSRKTLYYIFKDNITLIKILQNDLIIAWSIILLSCIISILLRNHFSAVCGFIGALVTTINSIILPILFYHSIYNKKISLLTWIIHFIIIILSIIIAILGVSSALCEIFESNSNICINITPLINN